MPGRPFWYSTAGIPRPLWSARRRAEWCIAFKIFRAVHHVAAAVGVVGNRILRRVDGGTGELLQAVLQESRKIQPFPRHHADAAAVGLRIPLLQARSSGADAGSFVGIVVRRFIAAIEGTHRRRRAAAAVQIVFQRHSVPVNGVYRNVLVREAGDFDIRQFRLRRVGGQPTHTCPAGGVGSLDELNSRYTYSPALYSLVLTGW